MHAFRFWAAYFKDIDRHVATGLAEFLVAETSLVDCSHGHWVPWAIRLHGVMCPTPRWMEPASGQSASSPFSSLHVVRPDDQIAFSVLF